MQEWRNLSRRALLAAALFWQLGTQAHAENSYRLETAHAEGQGTLQCTLPRTGPHHVALVYRDTYGVPEKYTLSIGEKPIGSFEANLTEENLIDGSRFWVWFSPAAHAARPGEKLSIAYTSQGAGKADILEIFFVRPDQLERLQAIIAQESIAVPGKHLYTKLVSHYDRYTWQKVAGNEAWVRIEAATGCDFGKGFHKGTAEGTARSLFVEFTAKVSEVRTWGYVEPAPGTLTKPIATMKCKFNGPRLFDGKEFWIATRGTTKHGPNQISPMFPMVAIDANGAQKGEIERCLAARKESPDKDPRFGGPIDWEAGPTVYVVAHAGMDYYPRHRDGVLKARPEMDEERILTAYMIRVADGTPESNKHRWPLYYWNSWLHRSDGQPLDEELTRRYAAINDPKIWFFIVGNPEGWGKYLSAESQAFLKKQGSWGPNSYLMYRIGAAADGRPRFTPHGHYLQPFADRR